MWEIFKDFIHRLNRGISFESYYISIVYVWMCVQTIIYISTVYLVCMHVHILHGLDMKT